MLEDGFFIKKLDNAQDLPLPKYMTEFASGMDLYANVFERVKISIKEIKLISAGIKIILPKNFEGQIRSRSGLSLKNGIIVLNSPGTIDADYRGEIKIILINLGEKDFFISRGDRIAQLVINKIYRPKFNLLEKDFDFNDFKTKRDSGGFGHTGV